MARASERVGDRVARLPLPSLLYGAVAFICIANVMLPAHQLEFLQATACGLLAYSSRHLTGDVFRGDILDFADRFRSSAELTTMSRSDAICLWLGVGGLWLWLLLWLGPQVLAWLE